MQPLNRSPITFSVNAFKSPEMFCHWTCFFTFSFGFQFHTFNSFAWRCSCHINKGSSKCRNCFRSNILLRNATDYGLVFLRQGRYCMAKFINELKILYMLEARAKRSFTLAQIGPRGKMIDNIPIIPPLQASDHT